MQHRKNMVVKASEVQLDINNIAARKEPRRVLMCSPDYFDVVDVKNPYMEGNAGKIDKMLACKQWAFLKEGYAKLVENGVLEKFIELNGAEGCEDMVFAANQSFPWITEAGEKVVIMSKMRHASRQKEVPFFEKLYADHGYKIMHLKKTKLFEGMGDAIPHPGKSLIYGGYGHRSNEDAYQEIAEILNVPIVTIELKDSRFYHLDTCFLPLDKNTVMLFPEAITAEDLKGIRKLFKNLIVVSEEEAVHGFALNAHVISDQASGRKVALIQKGSKKTVTQLKENGFEVIEADTSE
ncbi:MAG TPA: arginine deiminase family protein, partial [Cytophagaceae bacterium]|nr:arginine deiminase family protein [Cytophagaceae bacterium]